jgi:uncharacterized protein (TIGR02996 family)
VSIAAELLAVIAAQPDDPDPQLVLADHLLAAGDPRGELIVLDHLDRSTPGSLTDPAALDRLLLLAATYGFPCARARFRRCCRSRAEVRTRCNTSSPTEDIIITSATATTA